MRFDIAEQAVPILSRTMPFSLSKSLSLYCCTGCEGHLNLIEKSCELHVAEVQSQ